MEELFFTKYRKQLKKDLGFDDEVIKMLSFEAGRTTYTPLVWQHPFLFHALHSSIVNILYPLVGMKRKLTINGNEDFLFVSCPDPVFRIKAIDKVAGDLEYGIVFLPNFRINTAFKYYKFFRRKGIRVYFPTESWGQLLASYHMIKRFEKEIHLLDEGKIPKKTYSVLTGYLIYDQLVKTYMKQTKNFQGKWILEHDKFFFMSTVANIHNQKKGCTMLQHGVFFHPSSNYFPLFCDKVLCCSEREKHIYIENGIAEDRVEVFGAPLQTIQLDKGSSRKAKCYDLLVMMTRVDDENYEMMRKVLTYIRENYPRVLVRMRPRSRKNDKARLSDVLEGMTQSEDGSSIMNDLAMCDKVVSFSEDANMEVVKANKPFIYIRKKCETDLDSLGNCATEENYKDEIKKLMTLDFYSTFDKDKYKEILGENDIYVLRTHFHEYIKS